MEVFNRSSLKLAELGESSPVVDDTLMSGLRDVEGVDDGATVSSYVAKVRSQENVKLTLLVKNV